MEMTQFRFYKHDIKVCSYWPLFVSDAKKTEAHKYCISALDK